MRILLPNACRNTRHIPLLGTIPYKLRLGLSPLQHHVNQVFFSKFDVVLPNALEILTRFIIISEKHLLNSKATYNK